MGRIKDKTTRDLLARRKLRDEVAELVTKGDTEGIKTQLMELADEAGIIL